MCYHKSEDFTIEEVSDYYMCKHAFDKWQRFYHDNGFDHNITPVLTSNTDLLSNMSWGLIPWYIKTFKEASVIQNQTLNAISEEMFDKPSYRDSLRNGNRCLIPITSFFEWRHEDPKGKEKTPHRIFLKNQKIFSLAGIWSSWKNKEDGDKMVYTYSVLTTKANKLMEEIHNSKKRMPVIIPREFEKDWLNPNLSKNDVLAFCQPLDTYLMEAYPISKRITSKKDPSNVPEVLQREEPFKSTLF